MQMCKKNSLSSPCLSGLSASTSVNQIRRLSAQFKDRIMLGLSHHPFPAAAAAVASPTAAQPPPSSCSTTTTSSPTQNVNAAPATTTTTTTTYTFNSDQAAPTAAGTVESPEPMSPENKTSHFLLPSM